VVAGLLAPSYAPASPSKPALTFPCPLAPSDSSEVIRAQWETTTTMLKTLMGDSANLSRPDHDQWGTMGSRRCENRTADRGEARATLYLAPLRTRMGPQINSRPWVTSMFKGQRVGGEGVSAASATAYMHGTPRYRWC